MTITETGTVTEVQGDRAAVRFRHERGPSCGGCTMCQKAADHMMALWLHLPQAHVGDQVTVQIPVPSPWRAMAMVFGIPLVLLAAGVLVGSTWTGLQQSLGLDADTTGVGLGLVLAMLAFGAAIMTERRFSQANQPRVLEVRRAEP